MYLQQSASSRSEHETRLTFKTVRKVLNAVNKGTDRRSIILLGGTMTIVPFEAILTK